jgi:hypothetical protein
VNIAALVCYILGSFLFVAGSVLMLLKELRG